MENEFLFLLIVDAVDFKGQLFLADTAFDLKILIIGDQIGLPRGLMVNLMFLNGILLAKLPLNLIQLHRIITQAIMLCLHHKRKALIRTVPFKQILNFHLNIKFFLCSIDIQYDMLFLALVVCSLLTYFGVLLLY